MEFLEVVDWGRFQKVTRKRPMWIALYISILSNPDIEGLSDRAWRFLLSLWLLRADRGVNLPLNPEWLSSHTGVRHDRNISEYIRKFIELGFLRVCASEKSALQDRTGQDRTDKTQTVAKATVGVAKTSKPKTRKTTQTTPGLDRAWDAYPHFERRSKKPGSVKVWNRRLLESSTENVIAHIAAHMATSDWQRDGGRAVPGFQVFIGTSDKWNLDFTKPPDPVQAKPYQDPLNEWAIPGHKQAPDYSGLVKCASGDACIGGDRGYAAKGRKCVSCKQAEAREEK